MPARNDFAKLENYIADGAPNRIRGVMDSLRSRLGGRLSLPFSKISLQWGMESQGQANGTFHAPRRTSAVGCTCGISRHS